MRLVGQHDVRLPGDRGESCINSMALLPNNHMVLVDLGNSSVRHLDAQFSPLASHIFLTADPWDVTCVTGNDVAVTLPEANRVQVLAVAGAAIEVKDAIDVGMWCTGITCVVEDREPYLYIYVMGGYDSMRYIACFTLTGSMVRSIKIDEDLFKQPQFLTFNPVTRMVFISDWQMGVVGFNDAVNDGYTFHTDSSKYYWGVALDNAGNVYIGGHKQTGIIKVKHKVEKQSLGVSPNTVVKKTVDKGITIVNFGNKSIDVNSIPNKSTDSACGLGLFVGNRANTASEIKEASEVKKVIDVNTCTDVNNDVAIDNVAADEVNKDRYAAAVVAPVLSEVLEVLGINCGSGDQSNSIIDVMESVSSRSMEAASFKPMENSGFEHILQCPHNPPDKIQSKSYNASSKVPKQTKSKPTKVPISRMQIKGRQIPTSANTKKPSMSNQLRKAEQSTSKVAETRITNHVTEKELEPRAILFNGHNNTLVVSSFGETRNILYVYKL